MNIKRIVLIILIVMINCENVFSQNQSMENKIAGILALGKDSIINMGNGILKSKYPSIKINSKDFEISAWANKKRVVVRYERFIKFYSLANTSRNFVYDISIDIIEQKVAPFDIWGMSKFYTPTKEDLMKIEFVKKTLNLPFLGFENEIHERVSTYEVHLNNDAIFSIYTIDKSTGKQIYPLLDGHNDLAPEDEDLDPMIKIIE